MKKTSSLLIVLLLMLTSFTAGAETLRGDVDQDGRVNIADVTALIDYLLTNDATGISLANADSDLDGRVNIADVTEMIDYLLTGFWPDEPGTPTLSVNPSEIDFGLAEYGIDKTETITVTNNGSSAASFKVHSNPNPRYSCYYEVSENNVEQTLAPGASKSFIVTCHGIETGTSVETDVLVSPNAESEPLRVNLTARGMGTPLLDVNSIHLLLGAQTEVAPKSEYCVVTNNNPDIVNVRLGTQVGGGGRWDPVYHSDKHYYDTNYLITALSCGTASVEYKDMVTGQVGVLTITVSEDNHEWVDLGLPSGTLWATCNVGANAPEEYGDYFAWGETEANEYYNRFSYKWWYYDENGHIFITKYCTDSEWGTVDNKTELDPEDDAAYVNWGPSWRIPSREQIDELLNVCTWEMTTRNGVIGDLVTGPNGKMLFFPTAGYIEDSSLHEVGEWGMYWSRTLNNNSNGSAYWLYFHSGLECCEANFRYGGFSVRPVRVSQKNVPYKLSKSDEPFAVSKTAAMNILNNTGSYNIESFTDILDRLQREQHLKNE